MEKKNKLKLHILAQSEMAKREQNVLRGGACGCFGFCTCRYAGEQEGPGDSYYGGSSSEDNGDANASISGLDNKNN